MNRLKTYDATGIAPGGRLFAGDLNALQDAVAALTDLTQHISVADLAIGESGLLLSRFGAGEAQLSGALRASGIVRALGGLIYGAFTTTARNAITLPPFGLHIFNTDLNRIEWNAGTSGAPSWQPVGAVPVAPNTLANIPAASAVQAGSAFYATDQDVDYVSTGAAWLRKGSQAGDIIRTFNTVAGTGRVLAQGQAWPSTTGIYAALFAKIGAAYPTVLPDLRGRVLVTIGTHTEVSGIGNADGLAVGSRRMTHRTTRAGSISITGVPGVGTMAVASHSHGGGVHSHGFNPPSISGGPYLQYGGGGLGLVNSYGGNSGSGDTPYISSGGSINNSGAVIAAEAPAITGAPSIGTLALSDTQTWGAQSGSEPLDTVAYFVVQSELKL